MAGLNHGEVEMSVAHSSFLRALKGLSFDIPDLVLIKGWSEFHNLRMVMRLDHGSDDEEYEEVLAFYTRKSPLCRWIMWRTGGTVFVQPMIGRGQRYATVAEALESLMPQQLAVLTDIKTEHWP
jgi:hypothetical protein